MNKKIALILAPIIAAIVLGVGYAHWTETLYIVGVVSTGELDAEMSTHVEGCWDTDDYADYGQLISEEKDVSSIYCSVRAEGPYADKALDVIVTNGYPCIDYYQEFDVHSTGIVPLHINGFYWINQPDEISVSITKLDGTPIEFPIQLHYCEEFWGLLHVEVLQSAIEDTDYSFSIGIDIGQWNG